MMSQMRWSDMNFEIKNKELPKEEQPAYEWFKVWGYSDMEDKTYVPLDGYNRSKVANVSDSRTADIARRVSMVGRC